MERQKIEEMFYGPPEQQRRFTQDFPILPDVWIAYGESPAARFELLLTPHNHSDAASLARALRERVKAEQEAGGGARWRAEHPHNERPRILFNESVVLANFSYWELMRIAMPLTDWWARVVAPIGGEWTRENIRRFTPGAGAPAGDPKLLGRLIDIVGAIESERTPANDTPLEAFALLLDSLTAPGETAGPLWSISLNRPARPCVWRSRLAVKADAASLLFAVNTQGIRWAILDTGIDARHPALARRDADGKPVAPEAPETFNSRVVATYDFLRLKTLLDPDTGIETENTAAANMEAAKMKAFVEDLMHNLLRGRAIDWDLLEPFLRVPHDDAGYVAPTHPHGTHVAGIMAADWPEAKDTALGQKLQGLCPELELYDMRVLGEGGDEFTVMAALQFVRHLNAHKDLMSVHGVNMSMSVPHDVANYACGRTPVCEECERAVSNGVVVVAAAGNRGFNKLAQPDAGSWGDYRYISITDPGNAESVITVGATHRFMPHSYGVSYFSSRGPTGDGRTKPDLVAPGERIDSATLKNDYETMDGTSMAAPHVSGAAALLMARHRELMGQPRRIKEIICKSATDLGREPRFQGAGMLDVLRALQSV